MCLISARQEPYAVLSVPVTAADAFWALAPLAVDGEWGTTYI